jgi:hypothetical protein
VGLAALVLAAAGCGGAGTYAVSGKVTFENGEPVPGGVVSFRPMAAADGKSADSPVAADGTFRLRTFHDGDGALPGKYQVAVSGPRGETDTEEGWRKKLTKKVPHVSPKYRNPETSGIVLEVKQERNHFEIQVGKPVYSKAN